MIDDPGPVLFKQKRVGQKKNGEITYFMIWKFRSMKMSTPHDTPTHLLENPDQYITHVGRFIRKTSLDELPQIYQVFTLKLSIIGPRPALWSQEDLVAERDKYGAYVQIYKTEIIKKYRFPTFEGEKFVTESWMQDQIDQDYVFKVIHNPLMVCEYLPDGLTNNLLLLNQKQSKKFFGFL